MLFKQLFSVLKSAEHLDNAFEEFHRMLQHARWMIEQANDVLKGKAQAKDVREILFTRDQEINKLLMEVRGNIVRHLTITPSIDVAACLTLMNCAKDAERLGDYAKNLFEVGELVKAGFFESPYQESIAEIRQETDALFAQVIQAFLESHAPSAKEAIRTSVDLSRRCDRLIEQLLQEQEDISAHEAVTYTLIIRYFKRIIAHLGNICTAVTGKVDKLDFHPKSK